ncbi:hypothetical protein BH23PLA1_BH23PLA1_09710 [soil metagenome]
MLDGFRLCALVLAWTALQINTPTPASIAQDPGGPEEAEAQVLPEPLEEQKRPGALLENLPEQFIPRTPRTIEERDRQEAVRYYVAARALEGRRSWSEAIDLLEQALQRDPESASILRRLSRLHFAVGRTDPAVSLGRKAVEADPTDADTIRQLVRHYRDHNDPIAAETFLTEVLENPDLPKGSAARLLSLHELGLIYFDADQFDRSVEPLAELVEALDDKSAARLPSSELEMILGGDESGSYRRFGEAFFNAGRFDLAARAFRLSLIYDPMSAQTPIYLSQALLRDGQPAEALKVIEPVVADRPRGRLAFDLLGEILIALGRDDEILPRLETGSANDPNNVLLRYALAERYEMLGQVEKAQEVYQQVVATQPDPQGFGALADSLRKEEKYGDLLKLMVSVWEKRGGREAVEPQVKLISNDPEQADQILEAGLELLRNEEGPPIDPSVRLILIEIAAKAERIEKLIEIDRLNLEQNPSPLAFEELASTLTMAGRYNDAIETYLKLADDYPEFRDNPRLLGNLGRLQYLAGDLETALETGRKLLAIDEDDLLALEFVGSALTKLGRNDEAIEHFERIIARHEGDDYAKFARVWMANLQIQSGDFEKGEAILLELLEQDPEDAWINNDLGYLWADREMNLERAEQMIRKAVTQEPTNASYLDSLGWVLYKRGEVEEAVRYLEIASQLRGQDVTILDHLGDAYYRMGRFQEARDAWSKAQEQAARSDPPDEALGAIQEKIEALKGVDPTLSDAEDNP